MLFSDWLKRLSFPMQRAQRRPALKRHARLLLERLEDRVVPATNITVITGAAGAGSLDSFLDATHGTILTTDDSGDTAATLSIGALESVGAGVNISVAADATISFNDLGGTATLLTGSGNSAAFTTTTGAISFANTGNTLATSGGAFNFSAGTDLTVANLSTSGGDVGLTAGTSASGNLSIQGVDTSSMGDLTFQATGGTITQTGTASGDLVSVIGDGSISVDALGGTTVGITSNNGSISSASTNAITASTHLTLTAATGISVNTQAAALSASNSTSGDISITQQSSPAETLTIDNTGVVNSASGGTISLTNNGAGITVNNGSKVQSNNGNILLAQDNLELDGTINSGTARTTLTNVGSGQIDLGTNTGGQVGLTQAELNNITAGVLQIGDPTADFITISAAITAPATWDTLALVNNGGINETASGALTVAKLRISANGGVTLANVNDVGTLAADKPQSKYNLNFNNGTHTLTVGSVDGVTGIDTNGENITLTADNLLIEQAITANSSSSYPPYYPGGSVILKPYTTSLAIDLGGASVSGSTFGLTAAELEKVSVNTLQIGDGTAGPITVTAAIDLTTGAGTPNLKLAPGQTLTVNAAVKVAGKFTATGLNHSGDVANLNAPITAASVTGDAVLVNVTAPGLIQNGVDLAGSGGTVNVAAGAYSETVTVGKSLTLNGANAGFNAGLGGFDRGPETVLTGAIELTAASAVDGVTIDGFTILDGVDMAVCGGEAAAIAVAGAFSDVVLQNNILRQTTDNGGAGIDLVNTSATAFPTKVTIQNSELTGWNDGADVEDADQTKFLGNRVHDNQNGIYVDSVSTDVKMFSNMILDNKDGIYIEGGATKVVINFNNIIGNTEAGLKIGIAVPDDEVNAAFNFWGSPSGPTIASNPGGTGDAIINDSGQSLTYAAFLDHAAVPFEDLFAQAGSELSGAWQVQNGTFSVASSQLQATGPAGTASVATLINVTMTNVSLQADINETTTGSAGLVARYIPTTGGDANMYWGGVVIDNTGARAEIWKRLGGQWVRLSHVNVQNPVANYRFQVLDSSLALFVNGTLATSASDTDFTDPGQAGIWGASGTNFDNFFIQDNTTNLPFDDSFTQGNGTGLSSSWTQVAGHFTVQNEQLVANASGENFAILNGVAVPDALAQADVSLTHNLSSAGLSLRSSGPDDLNQYWGGIIRDSSGNYTASIWLRQNGNWIELTNPGVVLTGFSGSGTIQFEAYGSQLKLFVNGQLATFTYNTALTTAGAIGVWGANGVTFDNFHADKITPQTATLPFPDNFNQPNGDLATTWRDIEGAFELQSNQAASFATGSSAAILNGVSVLNSTVSATVTIVGSTSSAGVIARASTDDQNMYWGGIVSRNGVATAELWVKVNNAWIPLAASDPLAAFTGTAGVQMTVSGTSLQLFLDGSSTAAVSTTNMPLSTAGTDGIWASIGDTVDSFNAQ